jgi:hypothetical protein
MAHSVFPRFLSSRSQRLKGKVLMDKVLAFLNNRYLIAIIVLMFLVSVVRRFAMR